MFLTMCIDAQEVGGDKLGSWHMYFGTNRVSEKFSVHTEAQLRYYENGQNFNQFLLRTGLNYHIDANVSATVGYAFIDTDPTFLDNGIPNVKEHRIFEQLILKNTVGKLLFEHRYRLEQRFIRSTSVLSDPEQVENSTEHRARYRLQVTLPVTKVFFLNFYDEIFLNLQGSIYGQNRLYGALGAHVFKNTSVQVGFLKNHFANVNYDRLQIAVFWNPDFRGNEANKTSSK